MVLYVNPIYPLNALRKSKKSPDSRNGSANEAKPTTPVRLLAALCAV